jgi:hypothetical protein
MNKNDTIYKQCLISWKTEWGKLVDTRWLLSEFAKIGKVLKVRHPQMGWMNGWIVEEVGSTILSHEDILAITKDYKDQRIASDIDGVGNLEKK